MKFCCSLLVLLAVLFVPTFASPVESAALSKRALTFNLGITLGPIVIRDVETSVDGHLERAAKRDSVTINVLLALLTASVSIKRSIEEYKVIITDLPSNGLSGRSTDSYAGRHMAVTLSDALVEALKQNDVTEEQFPQYISNNVHAKDPQTGNEYELVPDYTDSSTPDITLFMDYVPQA